MLGQILDSLTDVATAEDAIAAVASPDLLQRVQAAAEAESVTAGALVASRVRHLIEHGGEDFWLDLLGVMSGSLQPGAAAIERILARAFPIPARAVTRARRNGENSA